MSHPAIGLLRRESDQEEIGAKCWEIQAIDAERQDFGGDRKLAAGFLALFWEQ